MLKIENLVSSYGVIKALKGISIEVAEGELVTLVGANGAGKSTLLKSIIGQVHIESGAIRFCGKSLIGKPSHEIIEMGIALVPEGRRIFADMTVVENMELGAYAGHNQNRFHELAKTVYDFFPRLEERKKQYGGTLSGGEQQMLAVGASFNGDAKTSASGRTVHGACACHCGRRISHHSKNQVYGHDHPFGRTKCHDGP